MFKGTHQIVWMPWWVSSISTSLQLWFEVGVQRGTMCVASIKRNSADIPSIFVFDIAVTFRGKLRLVGYTQEVAWSKKKPQRFVYCTLVFLSLLFHSFTETGLSAYCKSFFLFGFWVFLGGFLYRTAVQRQAVVWLRCEDNMNAAICRRKVTEMSVLNRINTNK